jgi:large subunit ribosomal protein L21
MHAIFAESGKQFYVQPGDTIEVDFRDVEPGSTVEFDRVLFVADGSEKLAIGQPYLPGAKVVASVLGDKRGKKLHVGFFRRRKNYRRHKGHRQDYTAVKVNEIVFTP